MLADTSNFLFPNATFIPEVVIFFVLLGLIAKYVLPPINRAMTARQEQIAQSLQVIEQAKTTEEDSKVRAEAVIDDARQKARAQIEQATKVGEELREEAARRGQEEYDRMLSRAQVEISRARERAAGELRTHFAGLVVATAEQVVGRELDAERHRALIDAAVAEVETSAS
ncbi:MAG: F0F1 ATP synthase subunit B [Acidimicrobiales bacterium]